MRNRVSTTFSTDEFLARRAQIRQSPLPWCLFLWAVFILVLYIGLRRDDVRPLAMALGARLIDLGVPLFLLGLHLPWASRLLRVIGGEQGVHHVLHG